MIKTDNKNNSKNIELLRKRYDDIQKYLNKNSKAKKILNELHVKTHFKAVIEMSNNRFLTKTLIKHVKYSISKITKQIYPKMKKYCFNKTMIINCI